MVKVMMMKGERERKDNLLPYLSAYLWLFHHFPIILRTVCQRGMSEREGEKERCLKVFSLFSQTHTLL